MLKGNLVTWPIGLGQVGTERRLETFLTCVGFLVIKGEKQALATFEGNRDPIYK